MEEKVILVDKKDRPIGIGEKLKAHKEGKLHRAFSVFVFNQKQELMLQQRAKGKYHCPGLWSNTCCSHPRPGEPTEKAAHRKLKQEMGFDCLLKEVFSFVYKVNFTNGLWEHEYDHVFIGRFDGQPVINPQEVESWRWVKPADLLKAIEKNPQGYTPWFRLCLDRTVGYLK